MPLRVAFCVSGNGALFRAALTNSAEVGIAPVLLVTGPTAAESLAQFASAHGVPHLPLDTSLADWDDHLAEGLHSAKAELVCLTFDHILPARLVSAFARRIINVHPTLLPSFPGKRGIERTLASGVRFGGATIHEVTDTLDAGPIIAQAVVPTIPGEELESFGRRIYAELEPMFLGVLTCYAEGRVHHDEAGHPVIDGASYGTLPISPAVERG